MSVEIFPAEEIVKRNVKAKRLLFTLDYKESVPNSDAVFIAVGTPNGVQISNPIQLTSPIQLILIS